MFIVTKDICSSVNDKDNVIPKGSLIAEQLVRPLDNGVFIDGAGIYVDDLVFASSTEKKIGEQNGNKNEV